MTYESVISSQFLVRVQEKTQGLKNTEMYVDHYHHKITEKFMNKMIISWDIYFYEDFYFFA